MQIAHLKRRKDRPLRRVNAVVVHTTGRGLTRAVLKRIFPDLPPHEWLDASRRMIRFAGSEALADNTEAQQAAGGGATAVDWYRSSGHPYFGHYLVDWVGEVWELAPPDRRVMHSGSLAAEYRWRDWRTMAAPDGTWVKHGRDPDVVYDWWLARWPDFRSPLGLATGPHPNSCSVGIDLLPTMTGGYTGPQLAALPVLIRQIARRAGFPVARCRVLGHSDIDPARRGTVGQDRIIGRDWDPGRGVDLDDVTAKAAALVAP